MFSPSQLPITIHDAYRLERELGAGGMSTVYDASVDLDRFDFALVVAFREGSRTVDPHKRLEQRMARYASWAQRPRDELRGLCESKNCPFPQDGRAAVKVLHEHFGGAKIRQRFEAEWISMLAIGSPHLVQVYGGGFCPEQELHYYAMELIEGLIDSDEVLALSVADKLALTAQAAVGLAALHKRGIVHRDIKPDNVLVTRLADGKLHAKVSDLGIAKTHAGEGLTATDAIFGTPCYIAPEAISGSRNATQSSDIYSLGASLYHVLAGQPPYHGLSHLELLGKIYEERPPTPIGELTDGPTPAALERLVARLMAFDPAQRPADMAAVQRLIGETLAALPAELATPRETTMPPPIGESSRRRQAASGQHTAVARGSSGRRKRKKKRPPTEVGGSAKVGVRLNAPQPTAMRPARLVLIDPAGRRMVATLSDARVEIGRAPGCTIQVGDPKLSKRHLAIERDQAGTRLLDLGSKNGTWVGEQELTEPLELEAGSEVAFGHMRLIYDPEPTSEDLTLEPAADSAGEQDDEAALGATARIRTIRDERPEEAARRLLDGIDASELTEDAGS